jgi:hypothetical protein
MRKALRNFLCAVGLHHYHFVSVKRVMGHNWWTDRCCNSNCGLLREWALAGFASRLKQYPPR